MSQCHLGTTVEIPPAPQRLVVESSMGVNDVQQTAGSPSRPCFGSSYNTFCKDVSLAVFRSKKGYTDRTNSLIGSSHNCAANQTALFIHEDVYTTLCWLMSIWKRHVLSLNTIYVYLWCHVCSEPLMDHIERWLFVCRSPYTGHCLTHRGMIYQLFVFDYRPIHFDKMEDWTSGPQILPATVFIFPPPPYECWHSYKVFQIATCLV